MDLLAVEDDAIPISPRYILSTGSGIGFDADPALKPGLAV